MNEQQLLVDCLRRLKRSNVAYYLADSMASNYWGIPRTTHDLDFVVQLPSSAVPAIIREFKDDFYIDEAAVRAAHQPPYQFNAIDTRSALKVDFWLPQPEPFDREMLHRCVQITLFGEPAWIATAEDVILYKLIWNRISPSDRQLGDAAGVVAVQAEALDTNYLRRTGSGQRAGKLNPNKHEPPCSFPLFRLPDSLAGSSRCDDRTAQRTAPTLVFKRTITLKDTPAKETQKA